MNVECLPVWHLVYLVPSQCAHVAETQAAEAGEDERFLHLFIGTRHIHQVTQFLDGKELAFLWGWLELFSFVEHLHGVLLQDAFTRDRLEALRESDAILREEFAKNGLEGKVWQYFTIVPDYKSTGVKDNKRSWDWPVIIRAVNTRDAMTATIEEIPYALLHHITQRVITEVPGVNRVLYDLTPKPTGTIEWE